MGLYNVLTPNGPRFGAQEEEEEVNPTGIFSRLDQKQVAQRGSAIVKILAEFLEHLRRVRAGVLFSQIFGSKSTGSFDNRLKEMMEGS